MLNLAVHILDSKKGKFDPGKFEDRYENALKELIKAKRAGKEPPVLAESTPSNVVNLMDALRRSAKGEKSAPARRAPAKSSGKSHPRKPAAKRKVRRAS